MNNLTEYELLQHRHLSLLRALQDKGVTCVMGKDGWEVTMPVKCTVCMDKGRVRQDPDGIRLCPACAPAPEIQIEQYDVKTRLLRATSHSNLKHYGESVQIHRDTVCLIVRPLHEQKCPVDFSGPSPFGGYHTTSACIDANAQAIKEERLTNAKHPASKDAGQWAMTINVDEKTHRWSVAIGDTMHIGLPYTSLMAGLLSALHAAIMDATSAKA